MGREEINSLIKTNDTNRGNKSEDSDKKKKKSKKILRQDQIIQTQ